MTTGQFAQKLLKLDQNLEIVVGNSFDYDNKDCKLVDVIPGQDCNTIKIDGYTILMDIGAFCMLRNKEELLDGFLDSVSKILGESANLTKEQVVDRLRNACSVKIEEPERCIPRSI